MSKLYFFIKGEDYLVSNYNFSTFDFPDINQNNLKNKTFNSTSIKSSLERIKALQKNISEQNYLLNNFLKIMKKNSSTTKDNSNEILKNSNNIEKMIEGLLDSYKRLLIESKRINICRLRMFFGCVLCII